MLMAALPPLDDDRPATRRDLAKEREIIDAKFEAVRAEITGVRREMRVLFGVVLVLLAALLAGAGA